ncbi:MAG: hypothetical protein ACLR8J_03915 [Sutterella wadsworthensis]
MVHNSVFSKNTASEYGGALFHGNGQFEVYDSEFTNNTSTLSGGAVASVFDVANTLKFVRWQQGLPRRRHGHLLRP